MQLIIGLGNPGKKYKYTRHNVGFLVLDKIQKSKFKNQNEKLKFKNNKNMQSQLLLTSINDQKVIFIKPLTYMNKSGEAVQKIVSFYKIKLEEIVVICDDINLDLGTVRIRKTGSDGGHNGLKSIINSLGTEDFIRFRVGVGSNLKSNNQELIANNIPAENYVLQKFPKDEQKIIDLSIDKTANIVLESISNGVFKEETIRIN